MQKCIYNNKNKIHTNYKKLNPYIKVSQILQFQCVHFVDFRYFLKTLKEAEFLISVGNFAHILWLYEPYCDCSTFFCSIKLTQIRLENESPSVSTSVSQRTNFQISPRNSHN